jgi:ACS family hexuronate transporter-like MFS transporter
MSTSPAPAAVSPWRWWVCGLLFLATTLNYMDRVALNQIADDIKKALALDSIEYSRLESGFSFAFAVGAVASGVVVDKVNVRWVYPAAVLGWSAAGVLTGYANGFLWLFACRVALGLFEAANWPCGIRTTKAVLRPDERSFGNSLFQSGTAIGAVCTPGLVFAIVTWHESSGRGGESWRLPFVLIGCLGVAWVALWFMTVPRWMIAGAGGRQAGGDAAPAGRYSEVFSDPRFWAMMGMVVTVNIAWHTYRSWFPLYLREVHGYTKGETAGLTTAYYLLADVGSWTVGLTTLVLIRRYGLAGHNARLLAYLGCGGLVLTSLAVPFAPPGAALTGLVLVYGFAALGLFPTYFAMSQELSVAHQGKVTGTLGAGAHLTLSLVVYPIQGWVIQTTGSYDAVLAVAGLFPLLGFALMVRLWPPEQPAAPAANEGW